MIEISNKTLQGFKYIDLFCGIGGFHIAMNSFGAECVFASDIDPKARYIYEQNFCQIPQGDILKIKNKDIPKHDILCAGFPCQPFSISGDQKGFEDDRGKLFFQIIRIVRYHKPKIILLENVQNLEKHNHGESLKIIKNKLNQIGYNVFYKVLVASDFNIPQVRKRLYIVAIKKSLNIKSFNFPKGSQTNICLKDILYDESGKFNVLVNRDFILDKKVLNRGGLKHIGRIGRGRQGERIYSVDGYSTTLSSQSGGLGGKTGIYLIDGNIRKLYPRECARLMGFPDSFKYSPEISVAYKQFGNSVVVDVVQHIIMEISNALNNIR